MSRAAEKRSGSFLFGLIELLKRTMRELGHEPEPILY
jgi:hypothetical protein